MEENHELAVTHTREDTKTLFVTQPVTPPSQLLFIQQVSIKLTSCGLTSVKLTSVRLPPPKLLLEPGCQALSIFTSSNLLPCIFLTNPSSLFTNPSSLFTNPSSLFQKTLPRIFLYQTTWVLNLPVLSQMPIQSDTIHCAIQLLDGNFYSRFPPNNRRLNMRRCLALSFWLMRTTVDERCVCCLCPRMALSVEHLGT